MMPQQRPGQDCRNLIAVRMTLYLVQTERYLLQVQARWNAQSLLEPWKHNQNLIAILSGFFEDLAGGASPRAA